MLVALTYSQPSPAGHPGTPHPCLPFTAHKEVFIHGPHSVVLRIMGCVILPSGWFLLRQSAQWAYSHSCLMSFKPRHWQPHPTSYWTIIHSDPVNLSQTYGLYTSHCGDRPARHTFLNMKIEPFSSTSYQPTKAPGWMFYSYLYKCPTWYLLWAPLGTIHPVAQTCLSTPAGPAAL